jgi:hypothetical protein
MPFDLTPAQVTFVNDLKRKLMDISARASRMESNLDDLQTLDRTDRLLGNDLDPAVVVERAKTSFAADLVELKLEVDDLPIFGAT